MKMTPADKVIQSLIEAIKDNLGEAHAVAKEAGKRSKRGRPRQALRHLMDFEGHSHDAHDLFKAALTISHHLLAEPE